MKLKNFNVVLLITVCLIVFGIWGLAQINKNEFPNFTIRTGVVLAIYPGATAEEVEEQLTKPLENHIFSYKEVNKQKTKSMSRHGLSIIMVELNSDFQDKESFWSKFKHGVASFKTSLPHGVLGLIVNDDFGDASDLLIAMESKSMSYRELHEAMEELQDQLRTIESVGRLKVVGEQKEQISVRIDPIRLSNSGLNYEAVALTLLSKGYCTTAGELRTNDYISPIYVKNALSAEQEVGNTIIAAGPTPIRLADIAEITREYPSDNSYVTNNGAKCLILSVEMKKGRSITKLGEEVSEIIENASSNLLPATCKLTVITDQAEVVSASVTNFLIELLIAIGAVVLVVLLLMPLRVALVASSTIPITIFISLGLFYLFDIELNTVTLAALVVTLGMVVDNSIVIIDSYIEKLNEGATDRWVASLNSARHYFKSILVATLAISVTFFPLLFTMDGTFRDFLTLFPWAISLVLAVSLAVAELVVPYLQYYFIKPNTERAKSKKFNLLDVLQRNYNKLIDRCFLYPKTTLLIAGGTVICAALLFTLIPIRLMPTAERNQFAVEIYLPTGTSLKRTAEVADSLESILRHDQRVVSIASFKGQASPRFQTGYAPQIAGENYAQFIVNATDDKATEALLDEYAPQLHDAFSGVHVRFKQLAYGTEENPIEVRITGTDLYALQATADSVMSIMKSMSELWLVRTDWGEPLETQAVTLDCDMAERLHISAASTELLLANRHSKEGITVGALWDKDYEIPVKLFGSDNAYDLPLEAEPIRKNVSLRDFAEVSQESHFGQICHRNGLRTITIKCDVERGQNVMQTTKKLRAALSDFKPANCYITYGGEAEGNAENMPKILSGLLIAVVIIFFLLLAHYQRVSIPALLLLSLVLVLPGTVAGVFIQGINFSLTCFLGIISLMGILVRNAIIMFDYADELRNEGYTTAEAIHLSAKRRMRPIFLTSAAASMGVVPMVLGGSGLWQPMGAVICYGSLITMLFILTVLPISYKLINK